MPRGKHDSQRDRLKLLVIFGAGASYDSVDLTLVPKIARQIELKARFRPPLAKELFDERNEFVETINRYPEMRALVSRLRRATLEGSGRTIEHELRLIQRDAEEFPRRKRHLTALEFYLADVLNRPVVEWLNEVGGVTNYVDLIDQIWRSDLRQPPLFVTFNYDRMLEEALSGVLGASIGGDLNSYVNSSEFTLIKPHGSVDWIQVLQDIGPLGPGDLKHAVIQKASEVDFSGPIEMWHYLNGRSEPYRPALAIPLDQGKTFVCPSDHLEVLSSDLEWVTHVLVIGWRATEQHFLSLLADRMRKDIPLHVCIVDEGGGGATLANLGNALNDVIRFGSTKIHDNGFSGFVAESHVMAWLSSTG